MRGWIEWARESFGPPMVGILFWCFAGTMVVMAAATAANSVFRDLVTGFGSMAQVALAFAVWRISRDQLQSTKNFNERQLRIMAFPQRIKMFEEYKVLSSKLSPQSVSDENANRMFKHAADMRQVFTTKTVELVFDYAEKAGEMHDLAEEYALKISVDESLRAEYAKKMRVLRKASREAGHRAFRAVHDETQIEPIVAIG